MKRLLSSMVPSLRVVSTGFALLLPLPVPAQHSADRIEKVEKVEVTGSRIATPDLANSSPVTVVKAEDIALEGYPSLDLFLNNLPQVFADQGNRISNGATGTAAVSLRGIGAIRTLVLVNGRRLPAGSPHYLAPDLNQIPAPLVSRVEVLTGGASAVYGSDAVAGVVNFILNDRFEGVQGEIGHSFYNHRQKSPIADVVRASNFDVPGDRARDGETTHVSLLLGGNFAQERGNATVFFSHLKTEAVLEGDRDFSACSLTASDAGFSCGGSFTGYPGRFVNLADGRSWTVANAAGGVRPWDPATDLYNFAPLNYFQRPAERYGFNASAHYALSADARVYAEFGFHDDHTVAQIAPSGLFGVEATIPFGNPLLSADWRTNLGLTAPGTSAQLLILRRNVEGGGRQDDIRHTSYREVIGVKGTLPGNWDFDLFQQVGRVVYQATYKNDFSISRGLRALDVVVDPATGAPVCASVLNGSDPNCVPYNIWSLGRVTPEALAYLQTPGFQKGFTSQQVAGATLTGDLGRYGIRFPGSRTGVETAFGAERRTEKLELETDSAFSTGDLAGQGGSIIGVAGAYTVKDFFGEIRAPLTGALSMSASYRYSDYSTGKTTHTYGLGFDFAPVNRVRLRGTYQQAVRAPDIVALFAPQAVGSEQIGDDCAGPAPSRSLAECQRTGVTPAQYGHILESPSGFYPVVFGGNADLKPETAKTWTLGVVFTPTAHLKATIDYFSIALSDTILRFFPTISLSQCLDTGDPRFCSLITRDPLRGTLWLPPARIVATDQNIGRGATSGMDVSLSYTHRLDGNGTVDIGALGSYLRSLELEPYAGASAFDCAGLYGGGCGHPSPVWRHRLRATWNTPWDFNIAATWRYTSSLRHAGTSSNPLLASDIQEVIRKLKAVNYFDVAGSWSLNRHLTLRAGVNNLLDRDPPVALTEASTFAQWYDSLGRYLFVSLTARF
ncbi:MAG TPA: TonB-dependent receptor [Usitatibacteraceae bacterium]|nr:TonB-dependent receptor [Usitatibacteraceae bacterium]